MLPYLFELKRHPEGIRNQPQTKETNGANEIESSYHSSPVRDQLALQALRFVDKSATACEEMITPEGLETHNWTMVSSIPSYELDETP
ncbi:MAG: hypothetical protein WB919_18360 [Candidatus Sulfotelmatobacter sp.]